MNTFTFKRKVNYYECDRMGITHHSNYIRFMEEARIELLDQYGYGFERMEAEGISSPVVSVNVEYRKPTTFRDEIRIEVYTKSISAVKLTFGYLMYVGEAMVCKAESVHCFFDNGRPAIIEERFKDLYPRLIALTDK